MTTGEPKVTGVPSVVLVPVEIDPVCHTSVAVVPLMEYIPKSPVEAADPVCV